MRIFVGRNPRSVVLSSESYSLKFERLYDRSNQTQGNVQAQQGQPNQIKAPTVSIKNVSASELVKDGYRELRALRLNGLLGLLTINGDVYVVVVGGVQSIGYPRWHLDDSSKITPEQSINKILEVDFISLDTEIYDHLFLTGQSRILTSYCMNIPVVSTKDSSLTVHFIIPKIMI